MRDGKGLFGGEDQSTVTNNMPKRNLRLTKRDQRTGNQLGALNEKHVVAKA
ncbi:hypothetical protein D3C71_1178700 [compost metagenome]